MSALFHLGQSLKGKVTSYNTIKHAQDCVWLARCADISPASLRKKANCERSQIGQIVVISVRHFRLENERYVLKTKWKSNKLLDESYKH